MYADYSKDQIDAFLKDITGEPDTSAFAQVSEDLLDDIMMAQMEMTRFRGARQSKQEFIPRTVRFAAPARSHPADLR